MNWIELSKKLTNLEEERERTLSNYRADQKKRQEATIAKRDEINREIDDLSNKYIDTRAKTYVETDTDAYMIHGWNYRQASWECARINKTKKILQTGTGVVNKKFVDARIITKEEFVKLLLECL